MIEVKVSAVLVAQLHLGRRVSRDSACRSSDHLAIGPPERRHGVEDLAPQPHLDSPEIDGLRVRAEQGDADAQYHLGVIYVGDQGVPQDDAEAVRWERLAAEQGDARAQSHLGNMYHYGEGVPQDDAEAVRWVELTLTGVV